MKKIFLIKGNSSHGGTEAQREEKDCAGNSLLRAFAPLCDIIFCNKKPLGAPGIEAEIPQRGGEAKKAGFPKTAFIITHNARGIAAESPIEKSDCPCNPIFYRRPNSKTFYQKTALICAAFFFALALPFQLAAWETLHPEASGFADFDIRENTEIRELHRDMLSAPTSEVLKTVREVFTQRGQDNRVAVEVRAAREAFFILFLNEEDGKFPVFSRGSWIVKRDFATGDFVQIKIFFHSDPGSFVRVFPDKGGSGSGKCLMDVYLFDRRIQHDVPLGQSLVSLLSVSFADIVDATRKTVNWPALIPPVDSSAYSGVQSITENIRARLPELSDADDGAMDKDGKMVFIESLVPQPDAGGFNCSGFVKWVADGLYAPLAGSLLDIAELKTKHPAERGSFISRRYEDERDPFFGLDWSRNIALAFAPFEPAGPGGNGIQSRDVRGLPYWKYMEDMGYPAEDLPAIMYYLALTEPGNIYIASVSREFGSNPVLRQHTHAAVLLPAIGEAGRFSCPVMETNAETSLPRLMERGDFIHLVRVKARPEFRPPEILRFFSGRARSLPRLGL